MSAEWVTAIATAGTFVVIAASAAAALVELRHLRGSNQIAARKDIGSSLWENFEYLAAISDAHVPHMSEDRSLERVAGSERGATS